MVRELIESGYIFVLPERDRHGRRVVFSVAQKLDPNKHNTSHVVRAHIATFEVRKNILISIAERWEQQNSEIIDRVFSHEISFKNCTNQ